jgi:cytidyltransferase-like protein
MNKPSSSLKEQLRTIFLAQVQKGLISAQTLAGENNYPIEVWARILSNLHRDAFVRPLKPKAVDQTDETKVEYTLTEKGRAKLMVVLTGGVFDIVHTGHIRTLEEARKLGDVLVAVVARNETVEKLKNRKPINDEKARLGVVNTLKPVDLAILGDPQDTYRIVKMVGPDIIALGYDQREDEKTVQENLDRIGLKSRVVRLSSYVPGVKTSRIISIIREGQQGKQEAKERR